MCKEGRQREELGGDAGVMGGEEVLKHSKKYLFSSLAFCSEEEKMRSFEEREGTGADFL